MKSIAFKYGFFMFVGYTLFFLLMHLLNMNYNLNLRIFNGVIHVGLLYIAIKVYAKKEPEAFNYLSGIAVGMWSTMIGVTGFALFQLIYLNIDQQFMLYIQQNTVVGEYMTPFTASLIIFMEGVIVGLLASYVCMRIVDMNRTSLA